MQRDALVLLVSGLLAMGAPTASVQFDEDAVKAAAIVNVARFVEWPGLRAGQAFVIAVVADDAFADRLADQVRDRRLLNHPVSVRRLGASDSFCDCQLLFVAGGEDHRAAALLEATRDVHVLTIGETAAFLREGGTVRLFRDGDRLRLQVNTRSADRAGLRISSRLLRIVDQTPQTGS